VSFIDHYIKLSICVFTKTWFSTLFKWIPIENFVLVCNSRAQWDCK